jgi:preprotein translocase subunit YajC
LELAIQGGLILAQESDGGSQSNPLAFLLPLAILGGLFYVILILPQRRRMKQAQQMRDSIGVGDEVRTVGGIYGTVREEIGETFLLDLGAGTTIRIAKRAVAERMEADEE